MRRAPSCSLVPLASPPPAAAAAAAADAPPPVLPPPPPPPPEEPDDGMTTSSSAVISSSRLCVRGGMPAWWCAGNEEVRRGPTSTARAPPTAAATDGSEIPRSRSPPSPPPPLPPPLAPCCPSSTCGTESIHCTLSPIGNRDRTAATNFSNRSRLSVGSPRSRSRSVDSPPPPPPADAATPTDGPPPPPPPPVAGVPPLPEDRTAAATDAAIGVVVPSVDCARSRSPAAPPIEEVRGGICCACCVSSLAIAAFRIRWVPAGADSSLAASPPTARESPAMQTSYT